MTRIDYFLFINYILLLILGLIDIFGIQRIKSIDFWRMNRIRKSRETLNNIFSFIKYHVNLIITFLLYLIIFLFILNFLSFPIFNRIICIYILTYLLVLFLFGYTFPNYLKGGIKKIYLENEKNKILARIFYSPMNFIFSRKIVLFLLVFSVIGTYLLSLFFGLMHVFNIIEKNYFTFWNYIYFVLAVVSLPQLIIYFSFLLFCFSICLILICKISELFFYFLIRFIFIMPASVLNKIYLSSDKKNILFAGKYIILTCIGLILFLIKVIR